MEKEEINEIIKKGSVEIVNSFTNASRGAIASYTFKIETNKLNEKFKDEVDITEHLDFSGMFEKLKKYEKNPALYVFQINEEITYEEIISEVKKTLEFNNLNFPAENKSQKTSGFLYVGKVKSCAWGRLIQHLGYHKVKTSHGLQLEYWVKKISKPVQLTYTVMFFEKDLADYIEILENKLAYDLKPMIGRH